MSFWDLFNRFKKPILLEILHHEGLLRAIEYSTRHSFPSYGNLVTWNLWDSIRQDLLQAIV